MFPKSVSRLAAILAITLLAPLQAVAAGDSCKGTMINPFTDIPYGALMRPIKIGGVAVTSIDSHLRNAGEGSKLELPICTCTDKKGPYAGIKVSLPELKYFIETVQSAHCSPTVGISFGKLKNGFLNGVNGGSTPTGGGTFTQVHLIFFPILTITGMITDMKCLEKGDFDFIDMSEFHPEHQNDVLALILKGYKIPLYGTPFLADALCAANTVLATTGLPSDYIGWPCGWGPLGTSSGTAAHNSTLVAGAHNAARKLSEHSEIGLIRDFTTNYCQSEYRPLWRPSSFRLGLVKPVRGNRAIYMGESPVVWEKAMNPMFGTKKASADNIVWAVSQTKLCCEKIKGGN